MEKSRIKEFKREHALSMPKVPSLICITVFIILVGKCFFKKIKLFKKINMFFIIFLNYFDVLMSKIILKK
jgi:hypothetical protein